MRTPLALLLLLAACAPSGPAGVSPAGDGTGATGGPAGGTAAERPVPGALAEPESFRRAVDAGTRTRTGEPGPRYWQQWAEYRIEAELDTATTRLSGRETVRYHNRSPNALGEIFLHVYPNLFAPGARKNQDAPVTEAVRFGRVAAQGRTLQSSTDTAAAGYTVNGTVIRLRLPEPLAAGAVAELQLEWSYPVPPDGDPRGGHGDGVWYVPYWYPQVAVYDDVNGWQTDPYLGNAEFYMGYGKFDVALTVPAGMLVSATGTLTNEAEVLSATTRSRLAQARRSAEVVHVVAEAERGAGPGKATLAGRGGKLTWRFAADSVRDFAFGASDRWLWDAAAAAVGDRDGDGRADSSVVHSYWRPGMRAQAWDRTARFAQHSVEFLSDYLSPYAYPQMSVVDGPVSCGGMEYPMMTCIGGEWDTLSMYEVVVHEIAHMWFPMVVGSDEKRFAWMDEGLTQFDQSQAIRDFWQGRLDDERSNRQPYLALARAGGEAPLMVHGDRYPTGMAYGIASYYKPATVLVALRGVLGRETFDRAFREYGRRWRFRHPQPADLWNTFENVSGRDLDWFWRGWFQETWTLDQAVAEVRVEGDSTAIVIEDRGEAPMPVRLALTRADGRTERLEVPVGVWLAGARRHTVRVPGAVTRVEIDPEEAFPDVDRTNQRR